MGLITEAVASAAAFLYVNKQLVKLLPDPLPVRRLSDSVVRLSTNPKILSLSYNPGGEIGWNSPLLGSSVTIEPSLYDQYDVYVPLRKDAKGKIRAFRPYAYIEKFNLGLGIAGVQVKERQQIDIQDFLSLLRIYVSSTDTPPGILGIHYTASVTPIQAISGPSIYIGMHQIQPISSLSIKCAYSQNRKNALFLLRNGTVLDSDMGCLFVSGLHGDLMTPGLSLESGERSGVRANIMRDSILKLKATETKIDISRLVKSTEITEAFLANDEHFLIPVDSIDFQGEIRTFFDQKRCAEISEELGMIHVSTN